jgi:ribose/xylose/arabinose/galactoside ABC-type transport system permease subunit
VLLLGLFSILQPNFLTTANLTNILVQASVLLIAATGMTFVVLTGGIDLSVGALMFLVFAMVAAATKAGVDPVVAVFGAVGVAALLGAFNGSVVAKVGVPAMIVTLAMLQAFRGAGGHLTDQRSLVLDDTVRFAGSGDFLGVPRPIVVAVPVVLIGAYVLRRTRFGRHVQSIGSNPSAALNAGLPVNRLLISVYALSGLCVGIAAMVQLGRLGAVQPTIGVGFELTVIAAVVLGGASLSGGHGDVAGTALGALLLVVVENGLVLSGASPYIFDIVRGAVLLTAILAAPVLRGALRTKREGR